jgi:hypothetical protein
MTDEDCSGQRAVISLHKSDRANEQVLRLNFERTRKPIATHKSSSYKVSLFVLMFSRWYVHLVMPSLNSLGFKLAKDKIITSADGEKTLKVVAVGYGRTGTVSPIQCEANQSHCRRHGQQKFLDSWATSERHPKFHSRHETLSFHPLRAFFT